MLFNKSLEIENKFYEPTKQVLIQNGGVVTEQFYGSRKILYSNNELCGFSEVDYYLPMNEDLDNKKFYQFLSTFKRSLYSQIRKNDSLLDLQIEFDGVSRDKNYKTWETIKSREMFYNIDLVSAYWQIAHKLGYISTKTFNAYLLKEEYKEAKRYCISFLARENEMMYYDGREINKISCDLTCMYQIYDNIRNDLYCCINEIKNMIENWVEYNIDGISVLADDLEKVCLKFNKMNLIYKINECLKIDNEDFYMKEKIRKF